MRSEESSSWSLFPRCAYSTYSWILFCELRCKKTFSARQTDYLLRASAEFALQMEKEKGTVHLFNERNEFAIELSNLDATVESCTSHLENRFCLFLLIFERSGAVPPMYTRLKQG